ncbi:MAG: hypothetical protein ACO3UU_03355 [Minisyncoccia bacterium]
MATITYTKFRNTNGFITSSTTTTTTNGSTGKFVDSITNKSATEISDSVQESMKKDPLKFAGLRYPLDIGSEGLGHYIVFYCISNNFGEGTASDKVMAARMGLTKPVVGDEAGGQFEIKDLRVNQQGVNPGSLKSNNSVLSKFPTHSATTGAIALYLPPGVKVNYGMTYDVEPTDLSGQALGTIGEAKSATGMFEKFKTLTGGVIGGAATEISKQIGSLFGSASVGDFVKLGSKALGVAINPHEEQFFNKPNFRTFSYTFTFFPKNEDEMQMVHNIIWLFKYHMHPGYDASSVGGRVFKVPSEFEIMYYYKNNVNDFLNKIARCVLETMDVTYGPEGKFSSFNEYIMNTGIGETVKGAPPVQTNMTLKFNETTFITKSDIERGY